MALAFQQDNRLSANVPFPPGRLTSMGRSQDLVTDLARVSGTKGAITLAYVLGAALLEAFSFSLLIPLLGSLFGDAGRPGHAALAALPEQGSSLRRLILLLSLFALVMSLRAVVAGMRDLSVVALQVRFTNALRLRLAKRLAAARWDHIARLRHARVVQLMGADIQRLAIGVEFMLRSSAAAVVLVALWLLAAVLAPALAVTMMALLGLGVLALSGAMLRTRMEGGFALETNLALLDNTSQFLGGLKLAMSQNLEDGFVRETGETLRRLGERQNRFMRQQARGRIVLTVLVAVSGAILLLVGHHWLRLSPPVLLTLSLLGMRMIGPVGQIQQGTQQFAAVLPVYESLRALEGELAGAAARRYPLDPDYPAGPVVFRHVSYRHPGGAGDVRGLSDFSLTLMPGEILGISGPSGVGKTTFADLLCGLYLPQAGEILAGGKRLEGAVLASWRRGLSYISQDAFLFHDTVRRNLSWANPLADENAMWNALVVAGAAEFVRELPNGLDTVVGERGTLVSGGERQRIALARALLRMPRLLVMDEATNALDSAAERLLLLGLAALNPRPTIVVIAHRLENLDLCDRVVLIEAAGGRDAS